MGLNNNRQGKTRLMSTELKEHLRNTGTWTRGLLILLFTLFYSIAEIVLGAIVLFQFGSQLIIGKTNDKLSEFSRGLNAYFYQILQFLTYRSDVKPYPFTDWPSEGLESVQQQESAAQQLAQERLKEERQGAEEETGTTGKPDRGSDEDAPEAPK